MLLAFGGEATSPSLVEVLSGVGLGAYFKKSDGVLFFGWEHPDNGIDNALEILGFASGRRSFPRVKKVPWENLEEDLKTSPAVIGPINMGALVYNPDYVSLEGADHFVLVYKIDKNSVVFHDPAGFPCVSLSRQRFETAWKADGLGYGENNYQYWVYPERLSKPNDRRVYQDAIEVFQRLYEISDQKAKRQNELVGEKAILYFADLVEKGRLSDLGREYLTRFVLKLGARRALDYASFFERYERGLSLYKKQQAELFGEAHALAVNGDWRVMAKVIRSLAKAESKTRQRICGYK